MKIKHLLNEQAENSAKELAELQKILAGLQKLAPQIEKFVNDSHYEFESIGDQVSGLYGIVQGFKIPEYYAGDITDAIETANKSVKKANAAIYQILEQLKYAQRSVNLKIEDIQNTEEYIRRFGTDEDTDLEEAKASRALCLGSKPDAEIGASQLASCKSQGFRARDGKKSHKIGKKRITVGGHKIKGKKYGGPLPDYGTRKDQR